MTGHAVQEIALPAPRSWGTIATHVMSELNQRQKEAVGHQGGPLLILAAAGSGKTRVLVHRIAQLLSSDEARPEQVLAVTFTNKAARELVRRCGALFGYNAESLWAGTFHGIGAKLLRRHAAVLDYPADFSIFDSDDQRRLLKDILQDADLDTSLFTPDGFRAFIETAKNEGRQPGDPELVHDDPFRKRYGELYRTYQERLRRLGAMDFGDLICGVLELFHRAPEVLDRYRHQFRHVLVDEYQDTNHAQYLMVSKLAGEHRNICVVGDDDQSIYGWRGASLRNILEFERDFPGATVVRLDQSYRSTGTIIAAARAVIGNNRSRMDKSIWTENPPGERIVLYEASDERDEALYIVDQLRNLAGRRGEAAVFYRTNAQSRAIEEALVQAGLPYVIVGTTRFYERREIKDLLAYLRVAHNPHDDLSLARVVNVPARGIGRTTWDLIKSRATASGRSIWDSIEAAMPQLRSQTAGRIRQFVKMVETWRARKTTDVTGLLESIISDIEYATHLAASAGDDALSRMENVRELVTVAQNFDATFDALELSEEDRPATPLTMFLEQLTLASEVDGYEARENAVTLMTVHNAKGLEYRDVFIAGAEESLFPHARSVADDERGIEEERRLFYVGVTRARERLCITRATRRHVFGATQFNFASRFLDEIPDSLLEVRKPHADLRIRDEYIRDGGTDRMEAAGAEAGVYAVGMKVVHPMFGVGTVKKCDRSGEDEKVVVQFQRAGVKKLVTRFARLQIV
jgi:DNA helicase-2/ATP-dependent DNA helicase PcrA